MSAGSGVSDGIAGRLWDMREILGRVATGVSRAVRMDGELF